MSSSDDFRKILLDRELRIGEGFDKTLITLSGGALGLTVTFVKDVVGPGQIVCASWLLAAWVLWSVSLTSILAAYYFGQLAYRRAIEQFDARLQSDSDETVDKEKFGGVYTDVVNALNKIGATAFVLGLAAIIVFTFMNLESRNERSETTTATAATSTETREAAHADSETRRADKGDAGSSASSTAASEETLEGSES